jgi:DNA end-binding protein Ku
MKAIWTGAIGFGLIHIPIKLYSAIQDNRPDFDLLDRKSMSRIRYKRVNEDTGKEVDWDQIVKGHYLKDRYIVLEDADFEEASPEKTKLIQLQSFIQMDEVESVYYDVPYYILPQKGGEKAYSLLVQALKKTKKGALSTFVMRNSENLAIVQPYENLLLLNKLRFAQELRPANEYAPTLSKISKSELQMAVELIKRHSEPFEIASYQDTYSKELMKLIRAKAKGKRPVIRKFKPQKSNSQDLLEQLKASLA